jgi:hypothetical protein
VVVFKSVMGYLKTRSPSRSAELTTKPSPQCLPAGRQGENDGGWFQFHKIHTGCQDEILVKYC